MKNKKVLLTGSERQPLGTRVADQPVEEVIDISVILKPAARAPIPEIGRKAVSRQEFAKRYGASETAIQRVTELAKEYDLQVIEVSPQRRTVKLQGSAADMMRAFDVRLDRYEHEGREYRARTGGIKLPGDMVDSVEAVLGLDNRQQAKPYYRVRSNQDATSITYTPPQVAQLYQFPEGLDGTGQTVGIIELGGGYTAENLQTYFSGLGITMPSIVPFSVDGGTNTLSGPSGADAEVQLDVEVIGAVAPGSQIVVYFAPNTTQGFQDALSTAIHDETNNPSVISISWGGPESSWTAQAMVAFDSAAQDAAALGVTICSASGDGGSGDGTNSGNQVDFPASSPHILACGGTSMQGGNGSITSETAWNLGGGGYSAQFPLPSWQATAGIGSPANGGRGVPDVSGDADPNTGYSVSVDGYATAIGGTSAVAPLWSGLIALMNQRLGQRLGFLQPALYALPTSAGAFRDIVSGTNGSFSAAAGWDACTGLGSPNGTGLSNALSVPVRMTNPYIAPWLGLLLS